MTPLTTPRTPLQILMMGRQNLVDGLRGGPYSRRGTTGGSQTPNLMSSETYNICEETCVDDEDDQYREKQLLALQLFANFLNTAETTLNDITERENSGHQVLGPGIVRVCNDLADEIDSVARALDKEHRDATEHLQQVMSDHELSLIEEGDPQEEEKKEVDTNDTALVQQTNQTAMVLSTLSNSESLASFQSQEEFITTLSTTHTLLIDMAAALRAVTQQEAQELGEVALEVARMFVWSLGMVHSSMIQRTVQPTEHYQPNPLPEEEDNEDEENDESKQKSSSATPKHRVTWFNESAKDSSTKELGPVVEILGEEEKRDDQQQSQPSTPPKNKSDLRYTPQLSPVASSPNSSPVKNNISTKYSSEVGGEQRVRVLWPPLLPAVTGSVAQCAQSATEHPIPAIALGLTCGPAITAAACIAGPPLLVADWAIQSSYDALSEHTPLVENVEKGAANALQVAKLGILCSKLVVKQGISVGERQIERRGGLGKICEETVGGAVDMITHPVETAGLCWEGLFWMGGAVRDTVGFVKDAVSGGECLTE